MVRFDVIDIVKSEDPEQIANAVMIIRAYRHSTTATLTASAWQEFLDMM